MCGIYFVRLITLKDTPDSSVVERSGDEVCSLGTLGVIPTEMLCEIISWASVSDAAGSSLYCLTRVSKSMAALALPEYIKINKDTLPSLTSYHIGLTGEKFNFFPAWICSDIFASRESLICHFTPPHIERKIDALGIGLDSLRPSLRPDSLTFEGDLNITQGLSLMDIAGRACTAIIDLEVFHLDWSAPQIVENRAIHKLAQMVQLRIEWPALSSQHWRVLLNAISAPRLQTLTLRGDVPWNALTSFLSRHPTITTIHLPASNITRVPQKHSALRMPRLLSIKGKLAKVMSLMKLLSSSSNLSIDGEVASNTPLVEMVNKIVESLAICASDISLVANLTSTKPNGPLTKTRPFPHKTLSKWRKFPNQLAHLKRMRLIVEGIEDSILLVSMYSNRGLRLLNLNTRCQCHCKNILSVFPRLRYVTLRRNSIQYGWEWARISRDVGPNITWDCMESSDYLE